MRRAADLLDADNESIAEIMTLEMGKTLASAKAEASQVRDGHALLRRARGGVPGRRAARRPVERRASKAYTRWQPIGPVLAVMPWNFPLWQVVRFAAPALMAGNVGLLKHASNVPQSRALPGEPLRDAPASPRAPSRRCSSARATSRGVLRDPRVEAATLTGSEPAGQLGRRDRRRRDQARRCWSSAAPTPTSSCRRPTSTRAAEVAVTARIQNNGQSCIAAKRFIVHEDVYDEFAERFVVADGRPRRR